MNRGYFTFFFLSLLLLVLAILLTLYYPVQAGGVSPFPIIVHCDCLKPVSRVEVAWSVPPIDVGELTDGWLFVWYEGSVNASLSYPLYYDGMFLENGKEVHRWHADYAAMDGLFSVNFYVRNVSGTYFWAGDVLSLCRGGTPGLLYLPSVWKGIF